MSPREVGSVMPIIFVDSVDDQRAFYVDKLGFDHAMGMLGKDGKLDFCSVMRGAARIMFSRPRSDLDGAAAGSARRTVEVYVEVADVDAYHDEVVRRGVKVITPLATEWWGDRMFKVADPYGYHIWFYQTVAEPRPPEGAELV